MLTLVGVKVARAAVQMSLVVVKLELVFGTLGELVFVSCTGGRGYVEEKEGLC